MSKVRHDAPYDYDIQKIMYEEGGPSGEGIKFED